MYPGSFARQHPDAPAVIMGSGEVVTYGLYEDRCNRFARFLRSQGLRRGDHIAVFMENNARYVELQGAADRSGLYYTLVNAHLGPAEVAYIVNDCQARVLVSSPALAPVATAVAAQCPNVERFLSVGAEPVAAPFENFDHVVGRESTEPLPDESMGAAMLYSSGTTGQPKGIYRRLPEGNPADPHPFVQLLAHMWRLRPGMVYLSPAPLYHSAPHAGVSATLRTGSTAVIMERFDPETFLALVEKHRVTHTQMVPTMFSRLLRLPATVRDRYDLSSLETVIHAAAPCPVPVKQAMIDWLGPILVEYYSSTEGNGFTVCDSEEWLAHQGTVGRATMGELLILDDRGQPCATGTPGTVWFRGASNFEYFGDPAKTAESRDAAGTASTVGDMGWVDADGYLYLTDRKSHMIISGGVNIYPQETENLLSTHPAVADVAVIGVPDEDLGEAVKAVVCAVDPSQADDTLAEELIAFCRAQLAPYKCPRSVDFVEELPRLPTGKLYKRLLRDRYWAGHENRIV